MKVYERAHAKINLNLDVVGRRADGYHELVSVMQTLSLYDDLFFERTAGDALTLFTNVQGIANEDNLICRAAQAYFAAAGTRFGVDVKLDKRIPMQAGLGGGSADAAATLRALNTLNGERFSREELARIGATVGADVPFCVMGGTRLCRGIGERMREVENNLSCFVLLVMAGEGISTPMAFRALDEKYGDFTALAKEAELGTALLVDGLKNAEIGIVAGQIRNRFEEVIFPVRPHAAQIKERLLAAGAFAAQMSGSGPALFALFEQERCADELAQALQKEGKLAYVCRFV